MCLYFFFFLFLYHDIPLAEEERKYHNVYEDEMKSSQVGEMDGDISFHTGLIKH